ncbi:two-component system sensor histidine kinase NtrB [Glacieibacterium sp.]|uniref:two-component system sensor histidine kinase NtrB n=1 Tax=Glacieibacterium sp. TaxID=2860237 RepID=UPI003B000588
MPAQALQVSEQAAPTATELFSALPVPVMMLDPDDRPRRANLAAETLLNTSAIMLQERGLAQLLVDGNTVLQLVAAARREGGGHTSYDVELSWAGRRICRADLVIAPFAETSGWLIVTIQPRAVATLIERQIVHRGAVLSATAVAAVLAHEIKNPLSGIKGAAQLIAQTGDEGARDLTTLICSEVDRIRDLVDRMEDFTDTRAAVPGPENIHAILSHVRRLAEQGFAAHVTLRESYDPSLPLVLGHRDSLVQVFLNLIKNAVEASGSHQEIQITTGYRQGFSIAAHGSRRRVPLPIEVCVIDSGPGAPADLVDHLFDPFVTTKSGGRGLGLALVAKIVAEHGGIVEYERASTPARTVLRVLLPMADQQ